VAPAWLGGVIPREWTRRYGQRGDDWRLPKAEHARIDQAVEVGWDGLLLLEAVHGPDAPAGLAGVEAVQVLRATWIQQFYRDGGQVRWRDKQTGLPPGKLLISTPTTWMPGRASNAAAPGAATRPTSPRRASPTGPT
jgi:transposase